MVSALAGQVKSPANNGLRSAILLATVVACGFLIPRVILFGQVTVAFVAWPWQFDYTEGVNLNATVQLSQGHNIYMHNGPNSFISAPYPPLFYLLDAPFNRLFGPSFTLGRIISLAATLLVAALLVYAVQWVTRRWLPGILAAMLWLSLTPVIIWAALYTQHILALMFGFAGLVVAMRFPEGRRSYLAALLFTLAFYTKQSAFDAAGVTTFWLFVLNKRNGIRFGLILAAMVGVPFLVGNLIVHGGLWEHLFSNQALAWGWPRFWRLLGRLLNDEWPLLAWALACSLFTLLAWLLGLVRKRPLVSFSRYWSLAVVYFCVALLSVLARLGRDGVNYNHFIDALLPVCLLVGLSLGYLMARIEARSEQETTEEGAGKSSATTPPQGRGRFAGALAALALLLAVVVVQVFVMLSPYTMYNGPWPGPAIEGQMLAISNLIVNKPGELYSEDVYLALANGKRVLYDDAFMFVNLAAQGKWDDSVYNRMLHERQFSLILLEPGPGRFTKTGRQLFNDNYELLYGDIRNSYVPLTAPDGSNP